MFHVNQYSVVVTPGIADMTMIPSLIYVASFFFQYMMAIIREKYEYCV